jgi:hypothetical protein
MKLSILTFLVILVSLQVAYGYYGGGYYGYHRPSYGYGYGYRPSYGGGYGYRPSYGGGYYGSYYGRRSFFTRELTETDPAKNLFVKPECVYYKGDGRLVCQGGSITVQCDADLNLNITNRFEFFAIKSVPFTEDQMNYTSFDLYPRSTDNEFWLNHTIWLDGKFVSFTLFYSNVTTPLTDFYGIRVIESRCFSDLIYLFAKSTFNYFVNLSTNNDFKFNADKVVILGDILITA